MFFLCKGYGKGTSFTELKGHCLHFLSFELKKSIPELERLKKYKLTNLKINNNIPIVWQISALHLNKKTLINGVLLKTNPFTYDKQIGWFNNLRKVIKSYFTSSYRNKKILITTNNVTISTITDKNGSFSVIVDFLHTGELKVNIPDNDNPLKIVQTYPVVFKNTKSSYDVISDIDDTIIVSYTSDVIKRIRVLALTPPKKRKVIGFSQEMFDEFKKQDTRVFYVSNSESNLFGMVTSFITHNSLPKGKLFLTPYLNFRQLIFKKKEKNSKLGDDGQRDMDIYSKIAREFPQSIIKIYIRQTKNKMSLYKVQMIEKLKSSGVPIEYFKSDAKIDVVKEIRQLNINTL
jgi:phosphatidate phosphatase APP1